MAFEDEHLIWVHGSQDESVIHIVSLKALLYTWGQSFEFQTPTVQFHDVAVFRQEIPLVYGASPIFFTLSLCNPTWRKSGTTILRLIGDTERGSTSHIFFRTYSLFFRQDGDNRVPSLILVRASNIQASRNHFVHSMSRSGRILMDENGLYSYSGPFDSLKRFRILQFGSRDECQLDDVDDASIIAMEKYSGALVFARHGSDDVCIQYYD